VVKLWAVSAACCACILYVATTELLPDVILFISILMFTCYVPFMFVSLAMDDNDEDGDNDMADEEEEEEEEGSDDLDALGASLSAASISS
jgi:hypothetical protein